MQLGISGYLLFETQELATLNDFLKNGTPFGGLDYKGIHLGGRF